jgi:hypothetical protein
MNRLAWAVVPALVLAGCSKKEEPPQQQAQRTLHEIMKDEIDTRADDVWAVGNAHIDNNAGLDASTMTDADWQKLAAAATSLRQGALDLAALDPIVVVRPGVTIADEGVPGGDSAESVQQNIDKDPQGYRDLANALAQHMSALAEAANKRDAATAGDLINELDGVCESCHLEYWYPSQKALVESIRQANGDDPTT